MTPKGIIIHHSLTKDGNVSDYEGIRRYHIQEKGWNDIGYHFIIELDNGKIATKKGRDSNKIGAHCVGKNDYIGICLVGNYDKGKEIVSPEKMQALVKLVITMLKKYKLTIASIHKHSEYASKTCPGSGFPWEEFIKKVKENITP